MFLLFAFYKLLWPPLTAFEYKLWLGGYGVARPGFGCGKVSMANCKFMGIYLRSSQLIFCNIRKFYLSLVKLKGFEATRLLEQLDFPLVLLELLAHLDDVLHLALPYLEGVEVGQFLGLLVFGQLIFQSPHHRLLLLEAGIAALLAHCDPSVGIGLARLGRLCSSSLPLVVAGHVLADERLCLLRIQEVFPLILLVPLLHAGLDDALAAAVEQVDALQGHCLGNAAALLEDHIGHLETEGRTCNRDGFAGAFIPLEGLIFSRLGGELHDLNGSRSAKDRPQALLCHVGWDIEQE